MLLVRNSISESIYVLREEPRNWVHYRACRRRIGLLGFLLPIVKYETASHSSKQFFQKTKILLKLFTHFFTHTESLCRTVIQWIIQTQFRYIFGACLVSKFVSTGWDEYLAGTGKILMSIIRKCYILENWYDQAI